MTKKALKRIIRALSEINAVAKKVAGGNLKFDETVRVRIRNKGLEVYYGSLGKTYNTVYNDEKNCKPIGVGVKGEEWGNAIVVVGYKAINALLQNKNCDEVTHAAEVAEAEAVAETAAEAAVA